MWFICFPSLIPKETSLRFQQQQQKVQTPNDSFSHQIHHRNLEHKGCQYQMERKAAYCALYFFELLLHVVIDVVSGYCWKSVDLSEVHCAVTPS